MVLRLGMRTIDINHSWKI